jgi:hypothetical protein
MKYKSFTSGSGKFWINLPEKWNEYDDGSKCTCAFFDSESKIIYLYVHLLSIK